MYSEKAISMNNYSESVLIFFITEGHLFQKFSSRIAKFIHWKKFG